MSSAETPHLVERSPGYFELLLPVSVKLIIEYEGKIPLLMNERDEWELPGGKLELGEDPKECVIREVREELNLTVDVQGIVDSWLYKITPERHVLIVAFGTVYEGNEELRLSHEHKKLEVFPYDEVPSLRMPQAYKTSIGLWQDAVSKRHRKC
jgi:8-oxo-dGTP pyrophosphatase MutT (NUDIX family)